MPMIEENANDSSSEDDEIMKQALREATDTTFLKKSFFPSGKSNYEAEDDKSVDKGNTDKLDDFGISEGFKDFVARKLSEALDRSLKEEKTEERRDSSKNLKIKDKIDESGVRLLSNSKDFLIISKDDSPPISCSNNSRKRLTKEITSNVHKLRCKEAAVDAEWVLSKENTKFWRERKKGIVFEYNKLADGRLIEK